MELDASEKSNTVTLEKASGEAELADLQDERQHVHIAPSIVDVMMVTLRAAAVVVSKSEVSDL